MGFWVAKTKNGGSSLWTSPAMVTFFSCMASRSAACVLGGVRLISSANTILAKMGPLMNLKYFIFVLFLFFAILPTDAQCAMCRAVLESEEGGAAAKGINNGIVYLMVFPYLLVGIVSYVIYRMRKKAKNT